MERPTAKEREEDREGEVDRKGTGGTERKGRGSGVVDDNEERKRGNG